MIMTEVLTSKKFAEELMKEAENKPMFSGIVLVAGALPQSVGEAKEARSSE